MKKILLSLLFVTMCGVFNYSYAALTKSMMIGEIRRLIHDSNGTSRQRWTDVQISTFINMAQDEIVALTWCLENKYSTTTVNGTTTYAMPTDFLYPTHVYYAGEVLPEISMSKLDNIDEGWTTASTGTPTYYYMTRNTSSYMNLYVAPDGAHSLDVWYIQQPAAIVNDTDYPFNGSYKLAGYHYLIVLWVTQYCALQEGKIGLANMLYQLYGTRIKDMRDTFNLKPNYSPTAQGG